MLLKNIDLIPGTLAKISRIEDLLPEYKSDYLTQMDAITALEIEHPVQAIDAYKELLSSQWLINTDQLIHLIYRLSDCLIRTGAKGKALYYLVSAYFYLEYMGINDFNKFDLSIAVLVSDIFRLLKENRRKLKIVIANNSSIGLSQIAAKIEKTCYQETHRIMNLADLLYSIKKNSLNEYQVLFMATDMFANLSEYINVVKEIQTRYKQLDIYPLVSIENANKLMQDNIGEFMILESSIRLIYAVLTISLAKVIRKVI